VPTTSDQENLPKQPKTKPARPQARYTSTIPQYLKDLDLQEDTAAYLAAAAAIEKLPQPPSLPGFLGKPILNAATPMKDDNSVLIMPNHTVLNHLATSSIKNNVLAVSATTRYKRKVSLLHTSMFFRVGVMMADFLVCISTLLLSCTNPRDQMRERRH